MKTKRKKKKGWRTGGERWSVPSDRTNLSSAHTGQVTRRGEYGTVHAKFDPTSHPPADDRSVVMLQSTLRLHYLPTLHMFFTGPTGFVLSSGTLPTKAKRFSQPRFQWRNLFGTSAIALVTTAFLPSSTQTFPTAGGRVTSGIRKREIERFAKKLS